VTGTTLPAASYGALFSPRSVAIVGASGIPGKTTARPVEFLRRHGWAGSLYPVNPARRTVLGEPAWPSLDELPTVPDHVLILTPADAAVDAVRQCARLGVPVATVVADGFLGSGSAGRDRRRALRRILDSSPLRLLGPGSLGVVNLHDRMALTGNAAFHEATLPPGDIFVASQSGSAIGALLSRGGEMGLGFRSMVSTGGEFDLTLGEICYASVDDPLVASYALFMENIAHADDLFTFARAAASRGKPVVAYKLGRSEAGAQLAISHTGAIAGDDAVSDAVLCDLGIARVGTFDALLEAQHIARQVPLASGHHAPPRVCVVSTTGGGGAMVVDCLASRGAVLDPPSAGTAARLAARGIATGSGALIDLTLAGATYATIRAALEIMLSAPEYDAVIAVPGSSARFQPEVSVAPIIELASGAKPLAAFVFPSAPDALSALRESGVSAFRTPEACADAIVSVFRRRLPRNRGAGAITAGSRVTVLDEDESYSLLAGIGIRTPVRAIVPAHELPDHLPVAGPAAVKVLSPQVPHKSDVGGVVLDVRTRDELVTAARTILDGLAHHLPHVHCDRLLVQEMVAGLGEALVGFRRDPHAGPVIVVAAGGLLAELYQDRSVRPAPIDLPEARQMVAEVHAFALLAGYRGGPEGDLEALAGAVCAMSGLASAEGPAVIEAEINPLVVLPAGQGVVAVDALVRRAAQDPEGTNPEGTNPEGA
jgi:acetate---CoA ligase (ADP-forming)